MNVGLYSSAAGMRLGEDYQALISENLALGAVPGAKQTFPVFSTDASAVSQASQAGSSGNPAAVRMERMTDFTQGSIQPSGSPYHLAIQGQGFFEVREANGTTSYTRNGSFSISPRGQLRTSDGAAVLGKGGSPITIDPSANGNVTIAGDGTISIHGQSSGRIGLAHFDNPSVSLHAGAYGRFNPQSKADAKEGAAPGDQILQGSLEQSNGNPITQMAEMIQAARLYEANQKTIRAADDNQNQLINSLGSRPPA